MHVVLLTIGQSPRPDMAGPLEGALPARAVVTQAGLLDGLSEADVARHFAPSDGGTALVTLLAGGKEVLICGDATRDALQAFLHDARRTAVDVVVMLCTGVFEGLDSGPIHLVQPDQIIPGQVAALAGDARVGVIVPTPAQLLEDQAKWAVLAVPPVFAAASPYADDWQAGIATAACQLADAGARWIVLDCMGFGDEHRDVVRAATALPVAVSRQLLAESLAALT